MESVLPYVLALVPTIGMATLFFFVFKSILEGDRRERLAQARWDKENEMAAGATGAAGARSPAETRPGASDDDRRP